MGKTTDRKGARRVKRTTNSTPGIKKGCIERRKVLGKETKWTLQNVEWAYTVTVKIPIRQEGNPRVRGDDITLNPLNEESLNLMLN